MKYSKQKLATAMAATMVVSMVPAMAFAAPLDDVVKELEKEDVSKAQSGDVSSAEAVLVMAKGAVAGDMKARLVVEAYEASINMFKATSVADWTAKKAAFDAAVAKLTFLDVSNSFKASQTNMNHTKVKEKLEAMAEDPKVKEVKDLLIALPEAAAIMDQAAADMHRAKVKEASDKYDALTPEQKAKVDAALVTKLNDLKKKVDVDFPAPGDETLAGLDYEISEIVPGTKVMYINLPASIDKESVKKEDVLVEGVAIQGVKAHKTEQKVAVAMAQPDFAKVTVVKLVSGGKTYMVTKK